MRKIWVLQGGEREEESENGNMEYGSTKFRFRTTISCWPGDSRDQLLLFFFPTVRWGGGFRGVFVIPKINLGQCSLFMAYTNARAHTPHIQRSMITAEITDRKNAKSFASITLAKKKKKKQEKLLGFLPLPHLPEKPSP